MLILIAIALGLLCSLFMPAWATRVFVTFNSIFSNFLSLFIPLLIIGLVAPGIAGLGRGAGRLLLITVGLAYFSTVLAGVFSYACCAVGYPTLLQGFVLQNAAEAGTELSPYFTIEMPPFISVTSALVVAFILGLAASAIEGRNMLGVLNDFRDIVSKVIVKAIIPCLPIYIFGIFLQMGSDSQIGGMLGMFLKVIAFIFGIHIAVLLAIFCIAVLLARKNPLKSLVTMLPAYVTALGTSSSAATIPVTLSQAKKLGVRGDTADFTVPLCATVHMPGSILKLTACAFAISYCSGMPTDAGLFIGFIMMLAITMVAVPGVPGGAIMASL